MKRESSLPQPPGFWETVRLLLSVARRRASGRMTRQQDLLQHRTGSRTNTMSALGVLGVWVIGVFLNGVTATVVHSAIMEAQTVEAEQQGKIVIRSWAFADALAELENASTDEARQAAERHLDYSYQIEADQRAEALGGSKEEHKRFLKEAVQTRSYRDFVSESLTQPGILFLASTGPFPLLMAGLVLLGWLIMLICQGEGLELDIQRRRNPMWEWLLSHPIRPGAVFLAEMLAPIAANPVYATGPLFFGILYGTIYGSEIGLAAAILIGVPVVVGAASLGKALEIGIMIRFPPRTRGALIGLMSWFGYAAVLGVFFGTLAMPQIMKFSAVVFRPLAIIVPLPLFAWATGMKADGSFSFISGMLSCWFGAAVMIGGGVAFSVWGAQRGLAGSAVAAKPTSLKTRAVPLVKGDPLYRKEILWFLRDRGAIVQAVLIPVTVAAFEIFNFRMMIQVGTDSWRTIAGIGVVFGTYFLWILGPRSLASEGQALWLAQTWPRGLEGLMKAKARLWFLLATVLVSAVFVFAIVRSPVDAWKVVLIAAGWIAFGRSMAEKSVTLVTVTSSSGEQEPIPKGRRWAAGLGMLTFAIGILGNRWELAVVGIVYSWITAAAMWENFRARLPFLFDPWSETVPRPPTLLHAMVAVSAFVEGGAIIAALTMVLVSILGGGVALAQALGVALVAIIVSLVTSNILANRGVNWREIWRWNRDEAGKRSLIVPVLTGVASGLLLGLLAKSYMLVLLRFDTFAELIREGRKQMESIPNLWLSFAFIAVICAPFAEEYLFRGLLFRALDREWGGWRALLGSAAFFTIYHPPLAWPPVFLVGLATALLFKKTGRLAVAVALHMSYNALVIWWN